MKRDGTRDRRVRAKGQSGGRLAALRRAFSCATLLAAACLASSPAPAASTSPGGTQSSRIGMIYVDAELSPFAAGGGGGSRQRAGNPIQQQLLEGLDAYRSRWGSLPQIDVPAGPVLRTGASGARVQMLRSRLGLPADGSFDAQLTQAVREFQAAHGLPDDGVAGARTVDALNQGAEHYERLIRANI
ncbi:MAG TPA: peptidoglycan-binding protein, partial [Allosphingosinicella sp.]|nr:peptidoglycan-binding protein [Allosphingosinicella sp.]